MRKAGSSKFRLIPGQPRRFTGKKRNVDEHLVRLREEFAGKPEICFEIIITIVYLRREIAPRKSWKRFKGLLEEHLDLYLENFSTRWLISICDTYADYGTPLERSNATLISSIVNLVKLSETIRNRCKDPALDELKIRKHKGFPLWDGITAFNISRGDMVLNLFKRINASFSKTPVLEAIWRAIFHRLQTHDNILRQLHENYSRRGLFYEKETWKAERALAMAPASLHPAPGPT